MLILSLIVAFAAIAVACNEESVEDLDVGSCANELSEPVSLVETVSCDDPHRWEVVGKFDLEGDDYPGDEDVDALALEGCASRAESYVGGGPVPGEVGLTRVVPNESIWDDDGGRTVICFIETDPPREGSIEGAGD